MAWWEFGLWMLPWTGLAIAALYAGHVAFEARKAREAAARAPPPGPDPVLELERLNTELAKAATAARLTLEAARDTVRRGTRG